MTAQEIIERLKAEIKDITEKARNTRINGTTQQAKGADAIIHALDNLMLKLSDLEKSEKPTTAEGLEEEIDKVYLHNRVVGYVLGDGEILLGREAFAYIARHFLQWGAEHRSSSEIPNIQDVNLAADNWICSHKDEEVLYIKPAFIAGARWQKEQMMKEAVDTEVKSYVGGGGLYVEVDLTGTAKFNAGQKVKAIFEKED